MSESNIKIGVPPMSKEISHEMFFFIIQELEQISYSLLPSPIWYINVEKFGHGHPKGKGFKIEVLILYGMDDFDLKVREVIESVNYVTAIIRTVDFLNRKLKEKEKEFNELERAMKTLKSANDKLLSVLIEKGVGGWA